MFQYALGRVLALKNNTELAFNIEAYENKSQRLFNKSFNFRTYDLDVFNIAGRIAKKGEIPVVYRMHGRNRLMLLLDAIKRRIFTHKAQEFFFKKFNPALLELGSNAYLDGFFQSYKYFSGFEDVLRKDFTLKNALPEHTQALKEEILNSNTLCVFVRRKDYIGSNYHEVVDKNYYDTGVEYIRKRVGLIDKIYVFSDDIDWCRNNLKFDIKTMFVGNEYAGSKWAHHMILMSCCKYFLVPNSTFSWWAAWLSERSNKLVVLPKKWVADGSANINDVAQEEWIKL